MALSPSELRSLSRKYAALGELRRARDEHPPATLGALAREFPGALRELDVLPLAEIDRRGSLSALALSGGPIEPLLEWVSAYHELMRAALVVKQALLGRKQPDADEAALLARQASATLGSACDAAFVLEVAAPPRGRLNDVVLARLSDRFGVPRGRLSIVLFGRAAASSA